MNNGLFQVTDRIYQVRGFDISNMTIIEGDTRHHRHRSADLGRDRRAPASTLYRQHRGDRPVTAVIYSHSHVDHYGGVRGVVDEADVKAGNVAVIAPDGFMEEVTKENVLAGTPMIRRAMFQFGATCCRKGPRGQVDAGLGKVTSRGTVTLIPPTQVDPGAGRDAHHRRRRDRSSSSRRTPRRRPRCTCSIPGLQRAEPRRERHPQPAQHLPDPRRPGARRQAWAKYLERGARPASRRQPTWCSRSTTGRCGAARACSTSSPSSATSTSTCTTRRCG